MKNKEKIIKEIRMELIKRKDYRKTVELLSKYLCSLPCNKEALIEGIGRSSVSTNIFTKIALMFLRKINYLKIGEDYKLKKIEKILAEEIRFIIPIYNPSQRYTEKNVPEAIKYEALVVEEVVRVESSIVEKFIDLIYSWFIYLEDNTEDVICNNISKKVQLVII